MAKNISMTSIGRQSVWPDVIFFIIWLFTMINICQSIFKIMPNTKQTLKMLPKLVQFLAKIKSGHTAVNKMTLSAEMTDLLNQRKDFVKRKDSFTICSGSTLGGSTGPGVMGDDSCRVVMGLNPGATYWMGMTYFTLICSKRPKINEKMIYLGPDTNLKLFLNLCSNKLG